MAWLEGIEATVVNGETVRGDGVTAQSDDSSIFVGRAHERAVLLERLGRSRQGCATCVLVTGEAGIGKTRLTEELAEDARRRGHIVLWGRCEAGTNRAAFLPWVRLLRAHAPSLGDGAADTTAANANAGRALSTITSHRGRLFDTVVGILARMANDAPVLLVLDDLQCADVGSVQLLEFAFRALSHARLLVVGTLREPPQPPESIAEMLARFSADAATATLPLDGLAREDIEELMARSGRPVDALLAGRVHERTGGNPLFAVEALRASDAGGTNVVPSTVRSVVRQRVNELPTSARRTLAVASVVGLEFDLPLLATLLDRPRSDVVDAIEAAVAARLLRPVPEEPGCWRFVHQLSQETIYDDLALVERVAIHARVGAALLARYGDSEDRRLPALAHHFVAAAPLGDTARAVEYVVRSAVAATRRLAYDEAAAGYACAVGLLEREGDADLARRAALELAHGDAEARAGRPSAARETFLRAAGLARRADVPPLFARAALGVGSGAQEFGTIDGDLIALLEEARSTLASDDRLRAPVIARLARAVRGVRPATERAQMITEAVGLARRADDPIPLAMTLNERHRASIGPDELTQRSADADEIVALARRGGDLTLQLWGVMHRVMDELESGHTTDAMTSAAAYERLAAAVRDREHEYHALLLAAGRAMLAGRFEEAERTSRRALDLGRRIEHPNAPVVFAIQIALIRARQGRLPEIAVDPAMTPGSLQWHPTWRAAVALAYAISGQTEAAEAEAGHLAVRAGELPRDSTWLTTLAVLTEVIGLLDNAAAAASLYPLLLPYASRVVVLRVAFAVVGTVDHCLARLAATLRRWDEALEHLEAAKALETRLDARPLLALNAHAEGCIRMARAAAGDLVFARSRFAEAASLARELGMVELAKRSDARLAAPPSRTPPSSASRPETSSSRVMRCEGEYWTLAFEGTVCRVRDAKGLRHLALLMRHPNRSFHVLDLLSPDVNDRARWSGDLGPVLDERARSEYRRRLSELQEERAEAQRCHDLGRAERLEAEIELVRTQLVTAMGFNGRAARTGSYAERARLVVTKRINAAVKRIAAAHPRLGHHLASSVRTGTVCVYRQSPGDRATWSELPSKEPE